MKKCILYGAAAVFVATGLLVGSVLYFKSASRPVNEQKGDATQVIPNKPQNDSVSVREPESCVIREEAFKETIDLYRNCDCKSLSKLGAALEGRCLMVNADGGELVSLEGGSLEEDVSTLRITTKNGKIAEYRSTSRLFDGEKIRIVGMSPRFGSQYFVYVEPDMEADIYYEYTDVFVVDFAEPSIKKLPISNGWGFLRSGMGGGYVAISNQSGKLKDLAVSHFDASELEPQEVFNIGKDVIRLLKLDNDAPVVRVEELDDAHSLVLSIATNTTKDSLGGPFERVLVDIDSRKVSKLPSTVFRIVQ